MLKKLLCVILTFALLFSISVPAFATSVDSSDIEGSIINAETADANASAKTVYENLTSAQKTVFLESIEALAYNGDNSLVEFHKRYVDPSYEFDAKNLVAQPRAAAAADIAGQLQALNLPTAVYYGLMALAAALGVPVGNVVDIVVALGLAVIIVANWDAISGVWQDIIDIFVDAFGSFVMEAFYYLQGLVGVYTVRVSGRTIYVNNDEYQCTTKAEAITLSMQNNGHSYYPAVLSSGFVWVAPIDIPRKVALAIMKFNSSTAGVFTISSSYAQSLCSSLGGAIGPQIHGSGSGYWWHYHGANYPNAHCWYIL